MELYEAMNEKIADIIAIDGTPSSLYASAYIKDLRAENSRLVAEIERISKELAEIEQNLIHADESVFYREQAVKLDEDKIKKQAVKEFVDYAKQVIVKQFSDTEMEKIKTVGALQLLYNKIEELYGADDNES